MDAAAKIRQWREYPRKFVWDNFAVEPDAWQHEALESVAGGGVRRLAMKACVGPGKSAVLAWLGWWQLACFGRVGEHPKGAAVAITRENLADNLWAELAKWQERSVFLSQAFTWTKSRIFANDHPETWFLSARGFAQKASREELGRTLSGLHSEYPFILLDESGDMPVEVGRAAEQAMSGQEVKSGLIAQAGNPTSQEGLLYESAVAGRHLWHVVTITSDPDDPKRTPRVSVEWAKEQIERYGRDNPWIMTQILGQFPPSAFNSLLGPDEVEAAMARVYRADQIEHAAKILGVDVARFGDDSSVIFPRQGLVAFDPLVLRNVDSLQGAAQVARKDQRWGAHATFVDTSGGYGVGWIDQLRVLGHRPIGISFAGKPNNPGYYNKRTEMHFELAQWVRDGGALPQVSELVAELSSPTYSFKGDRMILEPKDLIKKRLGRSPDLADSLCLTFAQPVAPPSVQTVIQAAAMRQQSRDWDPWAD